MIPDYHLQSKLQHHITHVAPRHYSISLHSLENCCKHPIQTPDQTASGGVHVVTYGKARRGAFIGLQMCRNSWSCPVCTPIRIAEQRLKITKLLNSAYESGYVGIMVTFTIPHSKTQSAAEVLTNLQTAKHAYDLWFNNRKFKSTVTREPRYKIAGSICACECKYSRTYGFHFHYHVVYVVAAEDEAAFRAEEQRYRLKWKGLTAHMGDPRFRSDPNALGLYISEGHIRNGEYLAKEICKASNGKRPVSMNMFDLLDTGDPHDKDIFIEYAAAVRGFARVRCSALLRKNLHITQEELTRAIVGEFDISEPKMVATFTFADWYTICNDEYDTGRQHRRWIMWRAQLDGFDGILNYCIDNVLPLPKLPYIEFGERNTLAAPHLVSNGILA